jgi:hypothetical protein
MRSGHPICSEQGCPHLGTNVFECGSFPSASSRVDRAATPFLAWHIPCNRVCGDSHVQRGTDPCSNSSPPASRQCCSSRRCTWLAAQRLERNSSHRSKDSQTPRPSSAMTREYRTSLHVTNETSCSSRVGCMRAIGSFKWISTGARPRERSRSCWAQVRSRATSSCGPSECAALRSAVGHCSRTNPRPH